MPGKPQNQRGASWKERRGSHKLADDGQTPVNTDRLFWFRHVYLLQFFVLALTIEIEMMVIVVDVRLV